MRVEVVFVAVSLVVVASVALSGLAGGPTGTPTYTINGMTCNFPEGTPGYVRNVVVEVTSSLKFQTSIGRAQYAFASFDNETNRIKTYGNVSTVLPDALELGFTTRGASTVCDEGASVPFINWVDVQVPIINGSFAIAAESVTALGGPK